MARRATTVVTTVLVGAMTLSLAGCFENFALGPVAIQRDGTDLLIAVCDEIEIRSVFIETRASGFSAPIETILDATGSLALESRSWISVSELTGTFTVTTQAPIPMNPGDSVLVQLLPTSSDEDDFTAGFTIGDDGLSETTWLRPDGRETDGPCF